MVHEYARERNHWSRLNPNGLCGLKEPKFSRQHLMENDLILGIFNEQSLQETQSWIPTFKSKLQSSPSARTLSLWMLPFHAEARHISEFLNAKCDTSKCSDVTFSTVKPNLQ